MTCALFCGFVLGLDRDIKKKSVDFRAYIIVCIAGALSIMTLLEMASAFSDVGGQSLRVDLSRAVQGVLLGIAFLGSATIVKKDDRVNGTATGAAVWMVGVIGIAFGAGFYQLGFIAFGFLFFTLVILVRLFPNLLSEHDRG